MMVVAPRGFLSLVLDRMQGMIAQSDEFQTWTGTGSESLAKARTYRIGVPHGEITYPVAVVSPGTEAAERIADASDQGFQGTYMCAVRFIAEYNGTKDDQDNGTLMLNAVGVIIEDIEGVSGVAGRLEISQSNAGDFAIGHEADAEADKNFVVMDVLFSAGGN